MNKWVKRGLVAGGALLGLFGLGAAFGGEAHASTRPPEPGPQPPVPPAPVPPTPTPRAPARPAEGPAPGAPGAAPGGGGSPVGTVKDAGDGKQGYAALQEQALDPNGAPPRFSFGSQFDFPPGEYNPTKLKIRLTVVGFRWIAPGVVLRGALEAEGPTGTYGYLLVVVEPKDPKLGYGTTYGVSQGWIDRNLSAGVWKRAL